jgi:hypothetical protein
MREFVAKIHRYLIEVNKLFHTLAARVKNRGVPFLALAGRVLIFHLINN